ncbi:MAG: hypothetical protein COS35_04770, partial [Zetaproteobacteria bacterium CG02_land_8_20_14_3_00_50_9]
MKNKKPNKAVEAAPSPTAGERINRFMAHCGLCSRREADQWIVDGRVLVNGKKINQPGIKI